MSVVLLLCLFYAVVRYHVFKGVPWEHLPLYTANKVLAMASTALIVLAVVMGTRKRESSIRGLQGTASPPLAREIGLLGVYLALGHAVGSTVLMRPGYFTEFFLSDGTLTVRCELALFFGICSTLVLLKLAAMPTAILGERLPLAKACLVLLAIHTAGIGLPGWFEPSTWPGGMPPLTLIGFGVIALGLLCILKS